MHFNRYKRGCECGCGCDNMQQDNCEFVDRQNYNCGVDRQVVRHQHIVKHQHDIINEYDVVHEHDYNYYDVVKTRDVVRHNDYTNHCPDYCCEEPQCCFDDGCGVV